MLFEISNVSPRNFAIRKQWLQNILNEAVDKENSTLSDMNLNSRAAALMLEAMQVFCAGNWVSALIVSQATIDAALWDEDGLKGINTNKLRTDVEYVWLRNRRNTILHSVPGVKPITLHDFDLDNEALEGDAKKALLLTIRGLTSFLY
tara:strand:- start:1388 stop:1831 length:444 start_codon:yes stop_codon:yes gene_type:complete